LKSSLSEAEAETIGFRFRFLFLDPLEDRGMSALIAVYYPYRTNQLGLFRVLIYPKEFW
jgi:hypothetical protein